MLTNYLKTIARFQSPRFTFSGVAKDQVDYYRILQVEPGATEKAIRAAYQ